MKSILFERLKKNPTKLIVHERMKKTKRPHLYLGEVSIFNIPSYPRVTGWVGDNQLHFESPYI